VGTVAAGGALLGEAAGTAAIGGTAGTAGGGLVGGMAASGTTAGIGGAGDIAAGDGEFRGALADITPAIMAGPAAMVIAGPIAGAAFLSMVTASATIERPSQLFGICPFAGRGICVFRVKMGITP
jgi:hypothetical protein